jgi:SET domain-containing protein
MTRLIIQKTENRGRGVFAVCSFVPGDLIEICPVLVLPPTDREPIERSQLYNYYFDWGGDEQQLAIALGYGSLYNHSAYPNALYLMDFEQAELLIYCHQPIAPGDEICFNYNGDPEDRAKVWFEEEGLETNKA